jgi:hypothetical protein
MHEAICLAPICHLPRGSGYDWNHPHAAHPRMECAHRVHVCLVVAGSFRFAGANAAGEIGWRPGISQAGAAED